MADGSNIGLAGDTTLCNWLQTHENVMDPYHVFVLHSSNSGNQFMPLMGILPEVTWEYTALGVKRHQDRRIPDGKLFHRVTKVMMPNLRIVANPFVKRYGRSDSVAWTLPSTTPPPRSSRSIERLAASVSRGRGSTANRGPSSPGKSTSGCPTTTRRKWDRARSRSTPRSG